LERRGTRRQSIIPTRQERAHSRALQAVVFEAKETWLKVDAAAVPRGRPGQPRAQPGGWRADAQRCAHPDRARFRGEGRAPARLPF